MKKTWRKFQSMLEFSPESQIQKNAVGDQNWVPKLLKLDYETFLTKPTNTLGPRMKIRPGKLKYCQPVALGWGDMVLGNYGLFLSDLFGGGVPPK